MNERAKLTDQELREAAAEAGISPEELRQALVQRSGGGPSNALAKSAGAAVAGYSAPTQSSLPARPRARGAPRPRRRRLFRAAPIVAATRPRGRGCTRRDRPSGRPSRAPTGQRR